MSRYKIKISLKLEDQMKIYLHLFSFKDANKTQTLEISRSFNVSRYPILKKMLLYTQAHIWIQNLGLGIKDWVKYIFSSYILRPFEE